MSAYCSTFSHFVSFIQFSGNGVSDQMACNRSQTEKVPGKSQRR